MESAVLTNREIASLFWLAILVIYVVAKRDRKDDLGGSIASLLRTLVGPKLLIPLLGYFAWLAGAVWLGARGGIWDTGLMKPTIVWALFAGVALFFGVDKAVKQESFWRETLAATAGATVLVEYYISFVSFPLFVELILQPIAITAVALAAYTAKRPGHESVLKLCDWTMVTIGSVGFSWVLWNLLSRWNEIDGPGVIGELFLPIWLTPAALAFVYVLALYSGYEMAFVRIGWKSTGKPWKVKLAYVSLVGVRVSRLRALDGGIQLAASSESTFRGARAAMLAELERRRRLMEPNREPAPPGTRQLSWSIAIDRGLVTLRGDLPDGYPTETWIDDRLVDRDLEGDSSWNLGSGLPEPVALIEGLENRDRILEEVEFWERGARSAPTEDSQLRQLAFASAGRQRASLVEHS